MGYDRREHPWGSYAYATQAAETFMESHLVTPHHTVYRDLNPVKAQPYLGYRPLEVVKKKLENTNQLAKMIMRFPMRRYIKARFPHLNVHRLCEQVATDTFFANAKSVYDGYQWCQVYFGMLSHVINVYGMKGKGVVANTY